MGEIISQIEKLSRETPLHEHPNEEQFSLVLSGQLHFVLGDEDRVVGPGTLVHVTFENLDADVHEASATSYALHLLRYDPLGRTLTLLAEMIERFAARGLDVGHERDQLAELQAQHQALLSTAPPNRTR